MRVLVYTIILGDRSLCLGFPVWHAVIAGVCCIVVPYEVDGYQGHGSGDPLTHRVA